MIKNKFKILNCNQNTITKVIRKKLKKLKKLINCEDEDDDDKTLAKGPNQSSHIKTTKTKLLLSSPPLSINQTVTKFL